MEIKDFLKDVLQISEDKMVSQIENITTPFRVDKGKLVTLQGEKQTDFIFLVSGIFRGYYIDANGEEVTDCFGIKAGTPCMSIAVNNGISPINIQAVTTCDFVKISASSLMPLLEQSVLLLRIYIDILQTALQVHWNQKVIITQHNSADRYRWFMESFPNLSEKVKDKDIASYLGMSPVTFSRVKNIMS